jgi:hypothetical protein
VIRQEIRQQDKIGGGGSGIKIGDKDLTRMRHTWLHQHMP